MFDGDSDSDKNEDDNDIVAKHTQIDTSNRFKSL